MSDGWFRREAAAAVPGRRDDGQADHGPGFDRPGNDGPGLDGPGAGDLADAARDDGHTRAQDAGFSSDPGSTVGFAFGADAGHGSGHGTGSGTGPDSWQESEHPEHSHDPHEVTVQLDGVGRHMEDWLVQQAKGAPGAQEPSDGPVFVDETGRRSRRYRRIGMAVGMACAVYAVVILVTLISGNSNAPWLPIKDQQNDAPAGKVEPSPLPTDAAGPSGSVSTPPEASISGTADATTPTPGASVSADPSVSETAPGNSADPKPSTTTTKPGSGNNSSDPGSDPPDVPTSPDPDPETSDPDVTNSPTAPAGAGAGAGTDTVAADRIAAEPTLIEPGPPTSSSPENIL
ncbi:hypothetical protein ACFFS2_36205 [Streptomyces aurantiacus]|uniref:Uncharacterized protein n=1 Tax=Streptomyces aurantiacus TaxID=47760 RepID=A0A7G1P8Q0_9ACTN|nr:hypothetical protein [Streptomyces aurantiacus]BCL30236.1 hypothetical protein GCM10017557_50950 [Streptomyces aurantiacus]